jgi:clan AA aspartic protease
MLMMGLTQVTTRISGFGNSRKFCEATFLVDTGATDSLVPGPQLEGIGVEKEGKISYELADGTVKEYPYGLARIEFMGETTAGRVIFGSDGCGPILGVTARESVGIVVDPVNKTLKRLPAIPLKSCRAG